MNFKAKKYRCLIIEDEPLAAEILTEFITRNKEFELVEICSDAIYANSVLKREKIDLIFLDLHLPVLKGFDFLRKIEDAPSVIVTTAYHEYALEGFELEIIDYLLKPIPYDRFLKAISKFKQFMLANEALIEYSEREFIVVNIAKRQFKIYLKEINYIESFREYIVIHTNTESIKVKMQIGKIDELLDSMKFKRVHKSYIVSIDKIDSKSSTELSVKGNSIPIGRNYKFS